MVKCSLIDLGAAVFRLLVAAKIGVVFAEGTTSLFYETPLLSLNWGQCCGCEDSEESLEMHGR